MLPANRITGCPCGHGYLDPCIAHQPLTLSDRAPCIGRCRGFGIEDIRAYSKRFGVCPCAFPHHA